MCQVSRGPRNTGTQLLHCPTTHLLQVLLHPDIPASSMGMHELPWAAATGTCFQTVALTGP
jgi:hypothetical protein